MESTCGAGTLDETVRGVAVKDRLKQRGYRWNGDGGASPRAWCADVDEHAREGEIAYLREEIYRREVEPPMRPLSAYDRFSDRV